MAMPAASDKRSLLQNERQSPQAAHANGISVRGQIAAVLNNFCDKHTEHGRDQLNQQD